MLFLTAVLAIFGLTAALATLVAVAHRALHVPEDPRIDAVEEMLPHANCGACGFPGCRPFAEALVGGSVLPAKCSVSSPKERGEIAAFLGVDVGAEEKRVARLACAGGDNVARDRARYRGLPSCAGAALVAGGGKGCFYGCLGLGDCERACSFDAIRMNEQRLPVVDEERCTACGDCVVACPKDLFSLQPIDRRLWVSCRSQLAGEEILADCEVACTACGRCAMDAPSLIEMRGNLPVIDYDRNHHTKAPIQRCPTGAIVWLDEGGPRKGPAARKIVRKGARMDAPT
ncbi:MAG: RnfABCDGE type electron transport complex subunit B [Planctomycetota bacterium]